MKSIAMRLAIMMFACLTVLPFCRADETAAITGLVTDPAGRNVPGAKIEITNLATNIEATTTTNDQGIYRVVALQPGIYRITVLKDGFKSIVKSGLELHVQDVASINFELQIGSVSETVTVSAGGLVINTQDASVSTVIDRQFAENLPLNGRSFQTLIQLTPGVVLTPSTQADSGQFSVNGQRADSNYWTVDGVSANIGVAANVPPGNGVGGSLGSFSVLGGTNSLVSVDALQEFRIQTSTYAPEFGRTPGGQISVVTRSGTNQWHGTAFDYFRNDALDANDWFADNKGLSKPKERQNDFGGTFGGPILKERTFFFFSYEGLRLRLPAVALTTVPDASFTPGGTTNSRQNAVAAIQPYLNAFPLPNPSSPEIFTPCNPSTDPSCPPTGQKPTGTAQFNGSYSNPATLNAYSLRIDHRLSKLTLFGRYNYSPSEINQRGQGGIYPLNVLTPIQSTTQTATVGGTWSISPKVVDDIRFNYSRTSADSRHTQDSFGGAVPLPSLPFPSPFTSQDGLFALDIFSLTGGDMVVGKLARALQRQINVIDDVSVQEGSHSLKFGIDFRRLSPSTQPPPYTQQAFFQNISLAENGNTSFSIVGSGVEASLLFHNLGVFAQDTWRIKPRLTITYGLRWDVDFAPSASKGPNLLAVTGFDLNNLSNLALAPAGTPPFNTTYGNVAPRVGLAYQLMQSQEWGTVLRGGFGVFYDLATQEAGNLISLYYPFGVNNRAFGAIFPLDSAIAAAPPITAASLASPFGVLFAFDPNLKLPYTLEWNVSIEQALGEQQSITASYVGSVGRRLIQTAAIASPNPNFGNAELVSNTATSDYNALQVQFQRRLSHGLQALLSYTWAHSIDDASAGSSGYASNVVVSPINPNANRGPSDFDIRNAFSAGITYDIPEPKIDAFAKAILRGWSLQSVILARSAPPLDVSDANTSGQFNNGFMADIRPDVVPGQPLYLFGSQCAAVYAPLGLPCAGGKGLNPNAFTDPPIDPNTGNPTRQGNLPRNALRAFGATQWDFGVHRDFPLHESVRLQFRAEMFNVLNHPNFGPPSGQFGVGGFGVSTQMLAESLGAQNVGNGGFNALYQIGGPRSIQLALKLMF